MGNEGLKPKQDILSPDFKEFESKYREFFNKVIQQFGLSIDNTRIIYEKNGAYLSFILQNDQKIHILISTVHNGISKVYIGNKNEVYLDLKPIASNITELWFDDNNNCICFSDGKKNYIVSSNGSCQTVESLRKIDTQEEKTVELLFQKFFHQVSEGFGLPTDQVRLSHQTKEEVLMNFILNNGTLLRIICSPTLGGTYAIIDEFKKNSEHVRQIKDLRFDPESKKICFSDTENKYEVFSDGKIERTSIATSKVCIDTWEAAHEAALRALENPASQVNSNTTRDEDLEFEKQFVARSLSGWYKPLKIETSTGAATVRTSSKIRQQTKVEFLKTLVDKSEINNPLTDPHKGYWRQMLNQEEYSPEEDLKRYPYRDKGKRPEVILGEKYYTEIDYKGWTNLRNIQ